jgi:hypothetical protein
MDAAGTRSAERAARSLVTALFRTNDVGFARADVLEKKRKEKENDYDSEINAD